MNEWELLLRQAEVLAVDRRPEACLGCGFEHSCSLHGCAVINQLVETVREKTDRLAAYEAIGMDPEDIKETKALEQIDLSGVRNLISEAIGLLSDTESQEENNPPLTLEELREMPLQEWLWVEIVHPTKRQRFHGVESSYYRIFDDYTGGEALCCGWPGTIFEFEFEDYGKNWLAYRHKPEGGAGC